MPKATLIFEDSPDAKRCGIIYLQELPEGLDPEAKARLAANSPAIRTAQALLMAAAELGGVKPK